MWIKIFAVKNIISKLGPLFNNSAHYFPIVIVTELIWSWFNIYKQKSISDQNAP